MVVLFIIIIYQLYVCLGHVFSFYLLPKGEEVRLQVHNALRANAYVCVHACLLRCILNVSNLRIIFSHLCHIFVSLILL